MKEEKIEIGERIRKIRRSLGLTLEEFAKEIDSTAKSGTVSNWETGKNTPNARRLKRISELGNVSIEYLERGGNSVPHDLSIAEIVKNTKEDSTNTLNARLNDVDINNLNLVQTNFLNSAFLYINNSNDLKVYQLNDVLQKLLKVDRSKMTHDELKELKFEVFKVIESIFENN